MIMRKKKHNPDQLTIDGLNLLSVAVQDTPPPSAIKWSGGKRSCARAIACYLPSSKRYFEPFLGGGSVLYCRSDPASFASDLYGPLIEFWNLVKTDARGLIDYYRIQWEALQEDLPDYFYVVRERFNRNPNGRDLCFLSRTCVNGIIRFNDNGEFNNSFHLSRKGMRPDLFKQGIMLWSQRLQSVDLACCDYREALGRAQKGDLVYMDPPYMGSKNRYISDLNYAGLLDSLEALNQRGVRWALSFDGSRGEDSYQVAMPKHLFRQAVDVRTGLSAVKKVLNGAEEHVTEKLYLNF
jgi:DNA adenine methylase